MRSLSCIISKQTDLVSCQWLTRSSQYEYIRIVGIVSNETGSASVGN